MAELVGFARRTVRDGKVVCIACLDVDGALDAAPNSKIIDAVRGRIFKLLYHWVKASWGIIVFSSGNCN